ncbi:MAG: hypothetical protein KDA47_20085, partial [Planctomycetales bacterium]|nr:hypothetical protein [Planctomycetales bacterium]
YKLPSRIEAVMGPQMFTPASAPDASKRRTSRTAAGQRRHFAANGAPIEPLSHQTISTPQSFLFPSAIPKVTDTQCFTAETKIACGDVA